jgi:hypothetical protein
MLPYLDAAEVLGLTRQGLDYFTGLFGMEYPFAKYDQVFVPDHLGAMENAGCVIISESLLFRSKVTDTMRELRATVILHEMAHQWLVPRPAAAGPGARPGGGRRPRRGRKGASLSRAAQPRPWLTGAARQRRPWR